MCSPTQEEILMMKIINVEYWLRYELAIGTHTNHQCDCNRMATRRGKCILCLANDLEVLLEKENSSIKENS